MQPPITITITITGIISPDYYYYYYFWILRSLLLLLLLLRHKCFITITITITISNSLTTLIISWKKKKKKKRTGLGQTSSYSQSIDNKKSAGNVLVVLLRVQKWSEEHHTLCITHLHTIIIVIYCVCIVGCNCKHLIHSAIYLVQGIIFSH